MRLLTPKNKPYVLFLLWVGIVLTISLWLVPPPEMPHNVRVDSRTETWRLPKANATLEVESSYSQVAPWNLFHNKTDPAVLAAEEARKRAEEQARLQQLQEIERQKQLQKPKIVWRLDGVIAIGSEKLAVIGAEKEHRQYKAGDLLPNGERLLEVSTDHILIQDGETQRSVKLFDLSNKAPSLLPPPPPPPGTPPPKQ